MTPSGNSGTQISVDSPRDNAELHAELRDVPLPAGFMHRVRQFVRTGLAEAD
jgi:hypothetical protein